MVDNFPENRLALAITHGPRQARIIRQQIQQYHQTSAIDKSFPIRMGFFKRWSLEVTFEESRQILGVETQRQWSDKAIERTIQLDGQPPNVRWGMSAQVEIVTTE